MRASRESALARRYSPKTPTTRPPAGFGGLGGRGWRGPGGGGCKSPPPGPLNRTPIGIPPPRECCVVPRDPRCLAPEGRRWTLPFLGKLYTQENLLAIPRTEQPLGSRGGFTQRRRGASSWIRPTTRRVQGRRDWRTGNMKQGAESASPPCPLSNPLSLLAQDAYNRGGLAAGGRHALSHRPGAIAPAAVAAVSTVSYHGTAHRSPRRSGHDLDALKWRRGPESDCVAARRAATGPAEFPFDRVRS